MNAGFIQTTVERAVITYKTISALPGPESSAAFGWACKEIMEGLNCNLGTAAALLRAELERRGE